MRTGRTPSLRALLRRALPLASALLCGACAPYRPPPPVAVGAQPAPSIAAPRIHWSDIGRSAEGRPILAATMGHGPGRVYLIGAIHGNEGEALAVLDGVLESLNTPEALNRCTMRIVRNMNPDGTQRGARGNARGVDLNRNWPAANFRPGPSHGLAPASEPETRAVLDDLRDFAPALVLVFHSTGSGPFVNYDGPAPHTARLAALFTDAANRGDGRWRTVEQMGYETPGSIGSFLGVDAQVPILTIELDRGHDAHLALQSLTAGLAAVTLEPTGRAPELAR